jgi:hypothetical protein
MALQVLKIKFVGEEIEIIWNDGDYLSSTTVDK